MRRFSKADVQLAWRIRRPRVDSGGLTTSSDAAFRDRYEACAKWGLAKSGEVAVDGGWRIYSSGPGVYVALVVQHALGLKRRFGKRLIKRSLPASQKRLRLAGVPSTR